MRFLRPVDRAYPVCMDYLAWGPYFEWLIDPETGYWIPKGSGQGRLGQHRGVDFACPSGTAVCAMTDGMIIRAGYERSLYTELGAGLHIMQLVQEPGYDAWWIKYGHLKKILVEMGTTVKRGQPLAETGQSGKCDHPKLHVDLMDVTKQYREIPW